MRSRVAGAINEPLEVAGAKGAGRATTSPRSKVDRTGEGDSCGSSSGHASRSDKSGKDALEEHCMSSKCCLWKEIGLSRKGWGGWGDWIEGFIVFSRASHRSVSFAKRRFGR